MTNMLPRPPRRHLVLAASISLSALLTGCADMGGITSHATLREAALPAPTADAATPSGVEVQRAVDAQWWRAFGDPQLDRLIDQALAGNPNLQVARARLARAQAQTGTAEAAGRPQLSGALDATRQQFSGNYIYPAPLGGSIRETATLQLSASWELDFFGKNRSALDAAIGASNAAAAEADAAGVLLASNVARSYIQWARLDDQRSVALRTLAQREETLRLVRDRVTAGLDTRLELRQSEGGLPEARQQIEAINEQIAMAGHALDALIGQTGAAAALRPPTLSTLHAVTTPLSLPVDLLGRRADIAAARWRVEAATSDMKNARTQFYPNINLVGFAGLASIGFDQLVKSGSRQWGVGPAIRLPIFDGGRLRANLRGKAADLDVAVESYNAAVLDAVRDVADQLTSTNSIVRQQAEQRAAQQAAEGAYDIAVQRYRAGLGNYLQVLTAETAVLVQRRQAVDLAARAFDVQIGLARAFGGGWQPEAAVAVAPRMSPPHP